MIEAALATPMMFLMLSGVIDFGRAYYFADAAASAARAGAQFGIESAANVGNKAGMEAAATTDAQGIANFTPTATWPYCLNATGDSVSPTGSPLTCPAGSTSYVKVSTVITYNLIIPWPGLANPLRIGGVAIMRAQ